MNVQSTPFNAGYRRTLKVQLVAPQLALLAADGLGLQGKSPLDTSLPIGNLHGKVVVGMGVLLLLVANMAAVAGLAGQLVGNCILRIEIAVEGAAVKVAPAKVLTRNSGRLAAVANSAAGKVEKGNPAVGGCYSTLW